jgi:hypothetical protein
MSTVPKIVGTAELALRVLASRGASAYLVYLVEPAAVAEVIEDLGAELRAFDETIAINAMAPSGAARLLQELGSVAEEVLLIDVHAYDEADWKLLDRQRSSLGREGVMVFFTTLASFAKLMQVAPNLASWLGGFVFSREDESLRIEEQRKQRLKALRAWSGKADDEVIRAAANGSLPRDPEYAEWIVLLGRGDLLDG